MNHGYSTADTWVGSGGGTVGVHGVVEGVEVGCDGTIADN